MLFKYALLMAMLVLGLALGSLPKLKRPTTPKIHSLEQQSELLSVQNPSRTQICFGYYGPKLNTVSSKYEFDYLACTDSFEKSSQAIYCNWNSTLYGLASQADYGCNTFADCSTIVDYVEAFECFARWGAQESKTMYAISANATESAATIQMQLQTKENQLAICVNEADRYFVEDTTAMYEELNACLNGLPVGYTTSAPTTIIDYQTTGF
ncbi:uncharacterized protein LOC117585232 [Drosophila guanche]|uniref:Protein TsetseEP domain-containing protein n=1 Tax=Drosophila guanche TaxID=7266 RepID=A0A3B0JKM0_DROGU|nr:uncharacterized protein LOC117585232 [Drosophila guanche]SPP82877.1 Hypothetical predicted protein [Drosophila guanche]